MIAALALTLLGGVVVELPPSAKVRGTELRLGDVATVRGDDPELVRMVQELVLGQTPSPGYARQLVRDEIARDLRAMLGETDLVMRGAPLVRISTLTMMISSEDQVAEARRALVETFQGSDVEFQLRGEVENLIMPEPRESFSVKARTASLRATPGPQGVGVDVTVDGVLWRTLWSSWTVDVYETWPVLQAAVKKGEVLMAAHFDEQRVKVSAGRITVPLGSNAYGLAEASRDLPVGHVVLEEDVIRAWTVQRGDSVQLEVKSGDVLAHVRGTVLTNGRVGDRVGVKLDRNEHEVMAVVVSKTLMRVDLTRSPANKKQLDSTQRSVAR
ncbi:MAG: flagella basal body P-ring formation protein FlgA [Planctomycetota bacterium]|jgi:flagella basal body P-ring formation protein FlgA